ncbi:hypothetical protein HPB52_000239 [Rhipicephalus sanguineus]|uniref:SP-RING-type domain-containing protein n=2 Tax=Rhipicephalus sanguineus TaxID=34632 RepID=A0A9D4SVB0_RHISA|nr:hypothetical protein HPB52_000239 [Rhipicephalus sanguineus]
MSRARSPERQLPYFKKEFFFEVLAELVPLVPLVNRERKHLQQRNISFRLEPQHVDAIRSSSTDNAGSIREFNMRVHLRFCLLDRNSEQDDKYPHILTVKVNGESLALPASIPRKVPGGATEWVDLPINIVAFCSLDPYALNKVCVTWWPVRGLNYVVGLFLVKKLSAVTILSGLRKLRAAVTRATIKKKAKRRATISDDVAITRFRVSLTCPLSRTRMKVPYRAQSCNHLDCFDGSNYLQVNERRPTWTCPVCGMQAPLSSLVVDQLFADILANVPGDCVGVVLHEDGSWAPSSASQRDDAATTAATPSSSTARSSTPTLKSSSGEQVGRSCKQPRLEVIDLTNSSSGD